MKNNLFLCLLAGFALNVPAQHDTVKELETVQVLSGHTVFREGQARLVVAEPPQLVSTAENLNFIPGITAFEGTAGTAKFSYRGFGARTQYSTSRSLVYLDEIPLTSLQGFSSFEEINPYWMRSFNLIFNTGQAFPLALGGILQYRTFDEADKEGPGISTQLTAGSFGLFRSNSKMVWHTENAGLTAGYEHTSREGWRENNRLQRESVFLSTSWHFRPHLSLRFLGYGIKSRVEIPSSLSREDFENDPGKAADSWARIRGFKEYERLVTGLTLHRNGKPDGKSSYRLTAFYRYLDNFEPRPFNILEENRHGFGLRGRWETDSFNVGKASGVLHTFAEYQSGKERNATFENTYDSLSDTFNHKGEPVNATVLTGGRINAGATVHSVLSRDEAGSERWTLLVGTQVFHQGNRFSPGEEQRFGTPWIPAPLGGFFFHDLSGTVAWTAGAKVYRSFSVPSLEENLDPDGSLNAGLKPELAWNAEVMSDLRFFRQTLQVRTDFYYSRVRNLIVPRIVGPDQVVASNSGRSRHQGLEARILFIPSGETGVARWKPEIQFSGYYGSFRYQEFSDTSGNYDGNKLPGFPEWQANFSVQATWQPPRSAKFGFEAVAGSLLRAASGYFVDDANTIATRPYTLLQSWMGIRFRFGAHWEVNCRGGVKNITNEKYASMTVVNNQAFGGGSPRFYYPGEPVNGFGEMAVTYNF